MTKKQIFIETITDNTILFLKELIDNKIYEIKLTEIEDFINNSIKDFYNNNKDIQPEDIKEIQNKENIKLYDLIKTNIYNYLTSNQFIFVKDCGLFKR